ncbi:CCA tRNA nucleotidyltransferase [Sphingosinicellaceae bacterium]|nr:CCA tRNA nucleotidyltransferase [Sphingosinicellaceae bacterium]
MTVPILPEQPWLSAPATRAVVAALGSGNARIVGGAVRDALLGLPVQDVDIATPLAPGEVIKRLTAARLKAVPTGIAHGTITAVALGHTFEVTTLRRDVATDGRHATVAFSTEWREDAARRDFTINALYADPDTREISDWFGGLGDLEARRVRFIGDPETRIAEDHLRILRFFRFHARFGRGEPDAEGLAACTAHANDLLALSRERIRDEVSKLLAVVDPVPVVGTMLRAGILAPVLSEIADLDRLQRLIATEAGQGAPVSWLRRLAALLPADPIVLEDIAIRLRLSNVDRRRLVAMAAPAGPDVLAEAYWDGIDAARDRRLLAGADADPRLAGWARPKLPASGRALIARGLTPGPEVSHKLGWFERQWVAAGFPAEFDDLLDRAVREG